MFRSLDLWNPHWHCNDFEFHLLAVFEKGLIKNFSPKYSYWVGYYLHNILQPSLRGYKNLIMMGKDFNRYWQKSNTPLLAEAYLKVPEQVLNIFGSVHEYWQSCTFLSFLSYFLKKKKRNVFLFLRKKEIPIN